LRYKNIKTGAIIDSSSKIVGKNWVEYTEKETVKEVTEENKHEVEYVEEEVDLAEMTKAELIKLAKEHEIKVNEKDTKAVIVETIAKAFE